MTVNLRMFQECFRVITLGREGHLGTGKAYLPSALTLVLEKETDKGLRWWPLCRV
jgi:hypothetical protein